MLFIGSVAPCNEKKSGLDAVSEHPARSIPSLFSIIKVYDIEIGRDLRVRSQIRRMLSGAMGNRANLLRREPYQIRAGSPLRRPE